MLSIYFPLQHFRKPSLYAVLAWGNLTSDQDAGLTGMTYNALNLLSGYTHSADGDVTKITYTASGEKTDVFTEDNQIVASHWHRSGNLIYDNSFSCNRLLVDGGYVEISNAGYTYRFYIQDHQGNNRMVTDANGTVLQVNHYDPYGQLLAPISSTSAVSEYKYGGKEWSDVTLSYDFGARNYLPAIPRWSTMDPLSEKYYAVSPYVYCAGNPVNLVDEDGRSVDDYIFDKYGFFLKKIVTDYPDRLILQREGESDIIATFADPKNDPGTVDGSSHVIIVSDEQIASLLEKSGVNNAENQGLIRGTKYLSRESDNGSLFGNGQMDYIGNGTNMIEPENVFYITYTTKDKFVAHNGYNFGNFLWGAGASALKIPLIEAIIGSNYYAIKRHGELDSRDDQYSIKIGYHWHRDYEKKSNKK